jgi:hypothetical protein
LYLLLKVTHLPILHPNVVVRVEQTLFYASALNLLAESLKYLLVSELINELCVVDDDLLHKYLILLIQFLLFWENGFLVEVGLKLLDGFLDVCVHLDGQLLMEGVSKEIALGLTLLDEFGCQLADLGDDGLGDHSSNVLLGVFSGFGLKILNFNFDDIKSLL